MNFRPLRVAQLIREELGKIIQRELEFPGALVTITEIEVTKKLETAHVLVSVFPEKETEAALRTLKTAKRELQHQLNRKLNIKPMPHIEFRADYGPENAARVEKTLLEQ